MTHCPTFMFSFNSLFNADQMSAPGSETTELLERKLSGEDYAAERGTLGLQQPLTPFHATEQADP